MEQYVLKNNLYQLTRFIRRLPNAYEVIKYNTTEVGVENEEKLKELFIELYGQCFDKLIIKNFLDVCAGPGMYSSYILEKNPKATGTGVSLCPTEGGCPYTIEHENYTKLYADIYTIPNDQYTHKFDFCMASCIPYTMSVQSKAEYKIIYKSLLLCLNSLQSGGTHLINFSFKNIFFAINFIYLIQKNFGSIKLFKSTKLWILQRTFYIVGYDYKNDQTQIDKITSYYNDFDKFYDTYVNKLLEEIDKRTLEHIMKKLESNVFMVQLKTYMTVSIK